MEKSQVPNIESIIVDYYLNSGDFNGVSVSNLMLKTKSDFTEIAEVISHGIASHVFRVISSDHELNPHIIREGFRSQGDQLKSLRDDNVHHTCVYPSVELLSQNVPDDLMKNSPFRRKLAMGMGQLDIQFFEIDLLEMYRNDPRYFYECNDIGGSVYIQDEHYESSSIDDKDKILLKAFGLAYDEDLNRYIAAFVGDIAELSSEHQSIWQSKIVNKKLNVHPDFYGSQVLGRWSEHISIFDAVLYEQSIINAMMRKIGKPDVFRKEFGQYLQDKPKEFAFLLRPTTRDYDDFVHLLDKLMSDNINKKLFKGDIKLENEIERKDGKIEVVPKGTIQLLDQWLRKHFRTTNWEPWEFAIGVFKGIRKQRQSPAHNVNDNTYDPKLIQEQRDLMKNCYESLAILRHALGSHPKCVGQDFNIPEAIIEQKIWTV